MRRVLGEFGSDLSHAVRLDQYYPVPRAVASYHLARHAEFGDYIPPSTSVVMERCFAADATISTSLIAVVPEAGYEIHKIHPSGVASAPTSGFVPAVVCHDFVFVAGQMAHNPGQHVGALLRLGPARGDHHGDLGDAELPAASTRAWPA